MTKQTKLRNHAGLASKKPIALRLTPHGRAEAERIADKLNCSMSLLASRAYHAGLPLVMQGQSIKSPPPPALSTGLAAVAGDAPATPSFSATLAV